MRRRKGRVGGERTAPHVGSLDWRESKWVVGSVYTAGKIVKIARRELVASFIVSSGVFGLFGCLDVWLFRCLGCWVLSWLGVEVGRAEVRFYGEAEVWSRWRRSRWRWRRRAR